MSVKDPNKPHRGGATREAGAKSQPEAQDGSGLAADGNTVSIPAERIQRIFLALESASEAEFDEADLQSEPLADDVFGALEGAMQAFFKELKTAWEESELAVHALEESRRDLEAKLLTIERQQLAIRDLAAPVIDLWDDIVTLPIVGTFDTERALDMTERLLQRIVSSSARCVIIDLTGVDVVDSMTADHLIRMTRAAQLLGSFCVVTGIGPDVARTLVDLGVDLGSLVTVRNLKEGLKICFAHLDARHHAAHRPVFAPQS